MSEGSVFQRKDGKWCGKWKDASGKWRYLYRKTKAEAKQELCEALRDRDDNMIPAEKMTLRGHWKFSEGMQSSGRKGTYFRRATVPLWLLRTSGAAVGNLH